MSSKTLRLYICLLSLSFTFPVAKASQPPDFGCNGSTLEIGSCLAGLYEDAETNLNAAHQNLVRLSRYNHATWAADFRAAENKWKEFRELNCTFYGNYLKGGSGAGPYYLACKVRMTEERVVELRRIQQLSFSCETKHADPVRIEPKWIKLNRDNQSATATEICRKSGFKIAAKGKRCTDGSEFAFDDPSECMRDAKTYESKTYADCYKFYSCESGPNVDGVNWDSILCQSAINAPEPFDCICIGNIIEQHKCMDKLHRDIDRELNITYQSLIRLVRNHGEDWVQDLRAAERKWIEFRAQNCRFYGNILKGDTSAGSYFNACKVRMTRERAAELQEKRQEMMRRGYQEKD